MGMAIVGWSLMGWREEAACRFTAIDFMATQVTDSHRTLCSACPVADECLAYALAIDQALDLLGIYAATTPNERRALRQEKETV